ncbi:MAG: hypothetical protein HUK26_08160 [Duodenibacillus sp.]|nr:hypothetical protein [Duodenibacillus sp.]
MCNRRSLLAAVAAGISANALAAPGDKPSYPGLPGYPRVRAGTQMDVIYKEMREKGAGISSPDYGQKVECVIVSDAQCPWCSKLLQQCEPLLKQVRFHWYPVCVLRDLSVTQGAWILQADDRWARFLEHEEHFRDADLRGLRVDESRLKPEMRKAVWENSKIFRRGGGTVVPFGIYRNRLGEYVPILSGAKTEELEQLFGVKAE